MKTLDFFLFLWVIFALHPDSVGLTGQAVRLTITDPCMRTVVPRNRIYTVLFVCTLIYCSYAVLSRILGKNLDKSLKSVPPCYSQSPLQLLWDFFFFKLLATSYISTIYISYHLYDLRHPSRNLKSENSQDYAQKPQRDCTFMNSASDVAC
jgi:hypothetical protein